MSGPSAGSNMPPPPPPATPGWTPPPAYVAPTPAKPMSERFSSSEMGSHGPWRFLALVAEGGGLLLVFIGTLVMIGFGSLPISCLGATNPCTSTIQGVAYGIDAAHFLWALGLFGLAAGAGLNLHILVPPAADATPEQVRVYVARRRGEFFLLIIALILLFLVMDISAFSITFPSG